MLCSMGSSPSTPKTNTTQQVNIQRSQPTSRPGSRQSQRNQFAWTADYGLSPEIPLDNETMVCEACKANFNLFKRKNLCTECKKYYCNDCTNKENKLCQNCLLFKQPVSRIKLATLKVKDLRQYLATHNISSEGCREKEELINLILLHINSRTPSGSSGGPSSQNGFGWTAQPSNLQNDFDRLYQQAHRHFFGGSSQPNGQNFSFTTSATANNANTSHVHGPFATNQHQYSSATTNASSSQHSRPSEQENVGSQEESDLPRNSETGDDTTNVEEIHENETMESTTAADAAPARRRASLTDLKSEEGIEDLSNRQLKEILSANFVDFKGCVERYELTERVKRLFKDRHGMKAREEQKESANKGNDIPKSPLLEENQCRICMDSAIDCVFLECGHMVTCTVCGKQMNECPICRQYVVRVVHIFRA